MKSQKIFFLSIGYFADGNWAYQNLIKIFNDKSINIKFICLRKNMIKKLKFYQKKNIPCFKFENVNDRNSIEKLKVTNVIILSQCPTIKFLVKKY